MANTPWTPDPDRVVFVSHRRRDPSKSRVVYRFWAEDLTEEQKREATRQLWALTRAPLVDEAAAEGDAVSFYGVVSRFKGVVLPGDPAFISGEVAEQHYRDMAVRKRVDSVVDSWGVFLPVRVFNEELGDYLEEIHSRVQAGQRVKVWLRVFAAMFWTGVNAIGYFLEKIGKRKAA